MPAELKRSDDPILDIDHINDLGLSGEDHPRNMLALCPNCHAYKTRGPTGRPVASRVHENHHAGAYSDDLRASRRLSDQPIIIAARMATFTRIVCLGCGLGVSRSAGGQMQAATPSLRLE